MISLISINTVCRSSKLLQKNKSSKSASGNEFAKIFDEEMYLLPSYPINNKSPCLLNVFFGFTAHRLVFLLVFITKISNVDALNFFQFCEDLGCKYLNNHHSKHLFLFAF